MSVAARSTVRALAWAVLACAAWFVLTLVSASGAQADEPAAPRPITDLVDDVAGPLTGSVTKGLAPATDPVLAPVERVAAPVAEPVARVVREVAKPVVRPVVEAVAEPLEPVDREVVAPVAEAVGRTLAPVSRPLVPRDDVATPPVGSLDPTAPLTLAPVPSADLLAGSFEAEPATTGRPEPADAAPADGVVDPIGGGAASSEGEVAPAPDAGSTDEVPGVAGLPLTDSVTLAAPSSQPGTSSAPSAPALATFAAVAAVLVPPAGLLLRSLPTDSDHDSQHHLRPDVSPG